MLYSKERFISLSDGIMGMMMTLMALTIAVPATTNMHDVMSMLHNVLVLFVSFTIIAMFWERHHQLFADIEKINSIIIWRNFIFLFFLALISIFVAALVKHPNAIMPIMGYGLVYLLANLSFDFLTNSVLKLKLGEEIKKIPQKMFVIRSLVMTIGILAITAIAFIFPWLSSVLFIGLPVLLTLLNVVFEKPENTRERGPQNRKRDIRRKERKIRKAKNIE